MSSRRYQKTGLTEKQKKRRRHKLKRFGLPKIERLSSKKEIGRLFSQGSRFSCGNLVIIYRPGGNRKTGFVASKKTGGAVKRTRIKRILREAYRMNKEIFKGLEIIFYAHGHLDIDDVINTFRAFQEQR